MNKLQYCDNCKHFCKGSESKVFCDIGTDEVGFSGYCDGWEEKSDFEQEVEE